MVLVDEGSIPAHTGKPAAPWRALRVRSVYPRTHGEAAVNGLCYPKAMGLSPHTRGSRMINEPSVQR